MIFRILFYRRITQAIVMNIGLNNEIKSIILWLQSILRHRLPNNRHKHF